MLSPKWKWWTSERPEHCVWLSGCFVCPTLSSCLVWAWLLVCEHGAVKHVTLVGDAVSVVGPEAVSQLSSP